MPNLPVKELILSTAALKKIMRDFRQEMRKGIFSQKSSLKMLATFTGKPTGKEKGKFLALDLGGTNLRILEVELKGNGCLAKHKEAKFVLGKKYLSCNADKFFGFIAACVKKFLGAEKPQAELKLGFTFSFPVRQTGIAEGYLVHWTKGFSVKGVVGKNVSGLLEKALEQKGLEKVKVSALVNDTVGTLAAAAYKDPDCDIGLILGTGTNACYLEGRQVINIEWGNFNQLKQSVYDIILDKNSDNPGMQVLEKMVSGKYLGEIARLMTGKRFSAEEMSSLEVTASKVLSRQESFNRQACRLVSGRAAAIVAASLAAVVIKIDPGLKKMHTVAVDGSVYEKYYGFAKNIKANLAKIFGQKAAKLKLVLTKDGSGVGAAIIAATVQNRRLYV